MTHILDDREAIAKQDPSQGLLALEQIGSQAKQAWEETQKIDFPDSYKNVKQVVVAGMGGSAYGTHVIQTLFKDELKVPVISVPDYTLPAWVNSQTLVVLSSYSGNTEETLSADMDAREKGAQITGLCSGGKLAAFLTKHGCPSWIYDPKFNLCKVPRYALGYSVFGQIALLGRVGLLSLTESMYEEVLNTIAKSQMQVSVGVPKEKNIAKLMAFQLIERMPVMVVAEHLEGAGHVVANAFNETAKTYSEYRVIPEINHHLMEGLEFPKANDAQLFFLTVASKLYAPENTKRMQLTGEVFGKNHCEYSLLEMTGASKIAQVFELLMFGAYTAFYLALLNGKNPTVTPWVDWFKQELKK